MELVNVIEATNLRKKYKGFELNIPEVHIPKGFATALIGENGAGKSTFINILAGIRLDYKGNICYFDECETDVEKVKERIGYTGPDHYYLPHWSVRQIAEISRLLYKTFDPVRYNELCRDLGIDNDGSKCVSSLSDGNRMKLTLATVLARKTECLLMDEPASPLDPLMRDHLCNLIREYLEAGEGEHSVFFSTHNIADMENVTDYCLIMENGKIVEAGFVEDLKEKYVLVKGEPKDARMAKEILYSYSGSAYGFEGICMADQLEKFVGMDVQVEVPSLTQISVAVMRAHSNLNIHEIKKKM